MDIVDIADKGGRIAVRSGQRLNSIDAAGDEGRLEALLDVLASRSDEMALRAYEIYTAAVPETATWSDADRDRFVGQSRQRFEAILAVAGQGEEVDDSLVRDLKELGMTAAWAGNPLPPLLMVLRISRDLVVQSAMSIAEEGGRRWSVPLSLLLTRVLPAMDRLTDALAQGYWAALVGPEEPARETDVRVRLVEPSPR
ncbi:MAG: hypothetical protein ACRD0C_06140 [Acidimicrobiia bacterium]